MNSELTNEQADRDYHAVMCTDRPEASTPLAAADRDFVYGTVWTRPGLSRRDRRFVTLACVCAADSVAAIDAHMYAALASGDISRDELMEFVLQFAVYCGWPKGSQAEMSARMQAIRLAEERGEPAPVWPQLQPESLGPTDHRDRLAEGERCFVDINLCPAPAGDSPYFHAGILGFVFGHLWQRPNLGRRERRLITVACVGVSDAVMPIYSHVGSALESGDITPAEMDEVILQFSAYSGFPKAQALQQVASDTYTRLTAGTSNQWLQQAARERSQP